MTNALTREEIIKSLQIDDEMRRRISLDPLRYVEEHPKQQEVSSVNKFIRALFWGNRVGKTEWGAMECAKVLLGRHKFIKPCEIWSFSTSFEEQKDTTQLKLLKYLPKGSIVDKIYLRKEILKEIKVKTDDGTITKLTFKSYEQGREKAQGAGKGLIWFDEEPPRDIFEECLVRQEAGGKLYIILTMTPVKGMTWVYNDIYLNTSNPDIFVSNAGWKDNPFLSRQQVELMSRNLSESALKVRRDGEFIKLVGLVCAWFDRQYHLVNIKELPDGDTYFGLDFGFSAPTCGLYVRVDREFNLWIFDGFYRKHLINPDIQQIIKLKEQGLGRVIRIGDSAQASDIKQLNEARISITGVKKETGTSKENWDEYRARMLEQYGRVQALNAKPKLFISNSLTDIDDDGNKINFLVKEIENLRWEEVKTEMGIQQKPIWGKQAKHAIDALSYILVSILQPIQRIEKTRTTNQIISNKLTGW